MKPKIICTQCNASLSWNIPSCPSCGASVEWPSASGSSTERTSSKDRPINVKPESRSKIAWTPILIAVGAIIVFLIAILFEQRPSSSVSTAPYPPAQMAPQAAADPGANMQLLQEIENIETRVKANPSDLDEMLHLANLQHDGRLFERAIATYQAYLKQRSNDVNARVDMGICMHEMGNSKDAVKEMMRSLKINPRHLQAHFNLGIITLSMGQVKESNEWFKKTVELDPQSEIGQRAQQLMSQHIPQQFK